MIAIYRAVKACIEPTIQNPHALFECLNNDRFNKIDLQPFIRSLA